MNKECENCIKNKTIYCPNSDKCLSRENKPFYEDKYTILTKVEALDETLKDYIEELQTLKIQISAREEVCDRLESNWNKLKEYIVESNKTLCWTNNYDSILGEMEELQRSDSNE